MIHARTTQQKGACNVQDTEYTRVSFKIPKWCKSYLDEVAWRRRTSMTGIIIELVKRDAEQNPDILNDMKMKLNG